MLDPHENEVILDACSAPGGKTTHLAELMNNKGKIEAWDIYEKRLDLVKENGSYQDYNVVENLGNTIVVGKDKEPAIEKTVEMEVETFENLAKKADKPNAGFVSYILLGVITFIISFALLFLVVK